jgi:hypothetical protein
MEQLVTLNVAKEKLKEIDIYWSQHGFVSRTEFIKFCCASIMDTHDDDSFLLVQEKYFHWLVSNAKDTIVSNVVKNLAGHVRKAQQEAISKCFIDMLERLQVKEINEKE